jgi:hypothetical protein
MPFSFTEECAILLQSTRSSSSNGLLKLWETPRWCHVRNFPSCSCISPRAALLWIVIYLGKFNSTSPLFFF